MPANKGTVATAPMEDEYVAQLLAKDARESSIKYSSLGMQAFMPKRPTSAAPKPNTRFLKNILRETDSHNANLKRKEEQEARERMRQLQNGRPSKLRLENNRHHDERNAKRRRLEEPKRREVVHKRSPPRHRRACDYESEHEDSLDCERERRSRRRRRRDVGDESETENPWKSSRPSRHRENDQRGQHTRQRNERSRSPDRLSKRHRPNDRDRPHRLHRRRPRQDSDTRSPSRSSPPKHSRSMCDDKHYKSPSQPAKCTKLPISSQAKSPETPHMNKDGNFPDDDSVISSPYSDPLSNLIGPLPPSASDTPPILSRGRGAYKATASNIDIHFTSEYDPTLDVDLGDDDDTGPTMGKSTHCPVSGLTADGDDWDMALEALRDRALWRRKGAERLREAGFAENVVDRWVNSGAFAGLDSGGREKNMQDVKWVKKGEGREWDRGKVMDEDGHVDAKASW